MTMVAMVHICWSCHLILAPIRMMLAELTAIHNLVSKPVRG